jgi:hypothetical protein
MNKISADQLAKGACAYIRQSTPLRSRTTWKANGCNTLWLIVPGSWDGQRSMSSMRIWGGRILAGTLEGRQGSKLVPVVRTAICARTQTRAKWAITSRVF